MPGKEAAITNDIVLTVADGQVADAARFFTAGTHLLELLDDLVETADVDWTVTELRIGSAVSGISATGEHRQLGLAAARSAVRGLTLVRSGGSLPDEWTPNAIGHAKDLVRRSGDHAKLETDEDVVPLDQRLRGGLEAIVPWVREFYGSVRGQLTGVNVTRGNRASIRPPTGGRVVHVGFPTALASAMREGLLGFVEVEGMIRQNDQGRVYYVTADNIKVVEKPSLSWRDLRGFMPELTGEMSTREYLESIRGKD